MDTTTNKDFADMINVGRFNRRIDVKSWQDNTNELGQDVTELALFKSVWAEIHPMSEKERIQAGFITNKQRYKITTSYFHGLTEDMYIVYNGKELGIVTICDINEQHQFYEIVCEERKKIQQKEAETT